MNLQEALRNNTATQKVLNSKKPALTHGGRVLTLDGKDYLVKSVSKNGVEIEIIEEHASGDGEVHVRYMIEWDMIN